MFSLTQTGCTGSCPSARTSLLCELLGTRFVRRAQPPGVMIRAVGTSEKRCTHRRRLADTNAACDWLPVCPPWFCEARCGGAADLGATRCNRGEDGRSGDSSHHQSCCYSVRCRSQLQYSERSLRYHCQPHWLIYSVLQPWCRRRCCVCKNKRATKCMHRSGAKVSLNLNTACTKTQDYRTSLHENPWHCAHQKVNWSLTAPHNMLAKKKIGSDAAKNESNNTMLDAPSLCT
jgi:hypothetical protein